MYSRRVLEQFQNMAHVGNLPDADVRVKLENPACGDVLELTMKIESGRIVAAKFRARGCVAAIACASQLTEMILNRTLAEARSLHREQLLEALDGLPEASMHASHLALEALAAALKEIGC